jgi:membrane protease subunit (stomatin/prohibitin family)
MGGRLRARAMSLMQEIDRGRVAAAPPKTKPAPVATAARSAFCAQCGAPADGDAKFCKRCGARL